MGEEEDDKSSKQRIEHLPAAVGARAETSGTVGEACALILATAHVIVLQRAREISVRKTKGDARYVSIALAITWSATHGSLCALSSDAAVTAILARGTRGTVSIVLRAIDGTLENT